MAQREDKGRRLKPRQSANNKLFCCSRTKHQNNTSERVGKAEEAGSATDWWREINRAKKAARGRGRDRNRNNNRLRSMKTLCTEKLAPVWSRDVRVALCFFLSPPYWYYITLNDLYLSVFDVGVWGWENSNNNKNWFEKVCNADFCAANSWNDKSPQFYEWKWYVESPAVFQIPLGSTHPTKHMWTMNERDSIRYFLSFNRWDVNVMAAYATQNSIKCVSLYLSVLLCASR